jgi:hypothetical protein
VSKVGRVGVKEGRKSIKEGRKGIKDGRKVKEGKRIKGWVSVDVSTSLIHSLRFGARQGFTGQTKIVPLQSRRCVRPDLRPILEVGVPGVSNQLAYSLPLDVFCDWAWLYNQLTSH